jgi:hypothetical protein
MAFNTDFPHSVNESDSVIPSGVAWGCKSIAAVIGRTERQTFNLLEGGHIRCARKVGGRWTAGVRALQAEFGI